MQRKGGRHESQKYYKRKQVKNTKIVGKRIREVVYPQTSNSEMEE